MGVGFVLQSPILHLEPLEETQAPQARVWHKKPRALTKVVLMAQPKTLPIWAGDEVTIPAPGPGPWVQNTASQECVGACTPASWAHSITASQAHVIPTSWNPWDSTFPPAPLPHTGQLP